MGILLYVSPASVDPFLLKEALRPMLHDYLLPLHIIPLDSIPADPALLPPPPAARCATASPVRREKALLQAVVPSSHNSVAQLKKAFPMQRVRAAVVPVCRVMIASTERAPLGV